MDFRDFVYRDEVSGGLVWRFENRLGMQVCLTADFLEPDNCVTLPSFDVDTMFGSYKLARVPSDHHEEVSPLYRRQWFRLRCRAVGQGMQAYTCRVTFLFYIKVA